METRRSTRGQGSRAPYWLVSREKKGAGRRGSGYHDVLTVSVGEEKVLPLFRSEESARSFLGLFFASAQDTGWQATEAWAGELLTMLSASGSGVGPCAGVGAVTFDPGEGLVEDSVPDVPTLGRRCFMDQLLGRGGRWSHERR